MKKILLLLTILATVFTASAQYSMIGNENTAVKATQFSHKIGINEVFAESITVFPNPVVDVLKVSFKSNQNGEAVISFFNNIGKQAFSQDSEVEAGNNIVSIDIRSKGIEPGIYFVQIKIGIDVATRKLIVK